jgi:hypothetical protein
VAYGNSKRLQGAFINPAAFIVGLIAVQGSAAERMRTRFFKQSRMIAPQKSGEGKIDEILVMSSLLKFQQTAHYQIPLNESKLLLDLG